jgi:hypothetical protein
LNFNLVVVGMELVFLAPIAAHEIVPGHEVSLHRQGVPVHDPLLFKYCG